MSNELEYRYGLRYELVFKIIEKGDIVDRNEVLAAAEAYEAFITAGRKENE